MPDIPKIKRNIGRMIDQGAPEEDIDAYLASEGVTIDQLKGAPSQPLSTMRAVDDRVRAIARGVPIIGGAMDEISAGLNTGFGYLGDYDKALEQERARDREFDTANPYESTGLQIAGGVAGVAAVPGKVPVPQTLTGKVGAGAGAGGLLGGWEAFTRAEGGFDQRLDAAKKAAGPGAMIGGAFPLLGYAAGKVYDKFRAPPESGLTAAGLKEQAGPLFDKARAANMTLKPEAYDEVVGRIQQSLGGDFIPENMPQLQNALNALEKRRGQPLPYSEIMNLREILKSAYRTDNPKQNALMNRAVETLDELVDGLNPSALVGDADPKMVSAIHGEARDLWKRGKNAELLETVIENAKNTVGANYTDAQLRTAVAQQLRAVAKDNFKNYKWLNEAERKAVLDVVRGGDWETKLRALGKYSPLTLGGVARTGGLAYGANMVVPGAGAVVAPLLGAAGLVARPAAEKLGKRNSAILMETLLQGRNVMPPSVAQDVARLGVTLGAPIAGRAGAPVAGLLGGGGW